MPQMFPYSWLCLYFIGIITLLLFLSMNSGMLSTPPPVVVVYPSSFTWSW